MGSELANASDLVCGLIRSAAVGNYQEALRVAPLLLPQIRHDPVLLPNLLAATAERLGTAGKAQNMANDLIDQSKLQEVHIRPRNFYIVWPLGRLSLACCFACQFSAS